VRAGSLSSRAEVSATTPAVAPADVVFGVGRRAGAEVVRVLWPSGVLQAEVAAGATTVGGATPLPSPFKIAELDRKPSSCPFLFTWNGERFEFVTDFLGGGEMGDWTGPDTYNRPDPLEYVRIREDQLRVADGQFALRITNELEETLFLDQVQLLAIAHPREHLLHAVREAGHRLEAHGRAHPLEGVRDAEDDRQRLGVGRVALQVEERGVEGLKALPALVQEEAEILGGLHAAVLLVRLHTGPGPRATAVSDRVREIHPTPLRLHYRPREGRLYLRDRHGFRRVPVPAAAAAHRALTGGGRRRCPGAPSRGGRSR